MKTGTTLAVDATKTTKRKKPTPEIEFRLKLERCSKNKDLSTAISLFTSATTGGDPKVDINNQHINSILYLCSNSVSIGDPDEQRSAIEFGFRVYDYMLSNNIGPSEATLTAVARLAAAKDDGDAAFELAKLAGNQGRLRTYSPSLICYCRNGMEEKAVQVEEHMLTLGLRLEESELAALLKVHVEKQKGEKVYEYMHKLRAVVREVTVSTTDVIESWFGADFASEMGLEDVDMDVVNEAKLKNGGGWHGLGWLGRGNWVLQRSSLTSDGICCACKEQLNCVDIDRAETDCFAKSIASLALEREVQSDLFKEFQEWIEECDKYEAIIDGANVGLFQQNFADGGFSASQLDAIVRELYSMNQKWPLIILHKKRQKALLGNPFSRDIIQKWIDQGVIYWTPYGSNDDWYWLYAAVKLGCMLVTNDEMRDHIFELLGTSLFVRWKERHQVKYTFIKGNLKLLMPPPYSLVIQESGTGSWHVPVAGDVTDETSRTWLCATRSGRLTSKAASVEASEEHLQNCVNEQCNTNHLEALDQRNIANEDSDLKSTTVTGKRKDRF